MSAVPRQPTIPYPAPSWLSTAGRQWWAGWPLVEPHPLHFHPGEGPPTIGRSAANRGGVEPGRSANSQLSSEASQPGRPVDRVYRPIDPRKSVIYLQTEMVRSFNSSLVRIWFTFGQLWHHTRHRKCNKIQVSNNLILPIFHRGNKWTLQNYLFTHL